MRIRNQATSRLATLVAMVFCGSSLAVLAADPSPGRPGALSLLDDNRLAIERQGRAVDELEARYGPYDIRLKEALRGLGFQLKKGGDLHGARHAYNRALHVSRVNEGLHSASQIPVVERLIEVDLRLGDWSEVDRHYTLLEHLYRKLYDMNDPRLEEGLRKIVAWHFDASNVNLDGKRIDHLRKALGLLKLRLQIAELTLSGEDPLFDSLKQNIARSERFIYLASDLNKEIESRRRRSLRDGILANND